MVAALLTAMVATQASPRVVLVYPEVSRYLERAAATPVAQRTELYYKLVLEPHLGDCFAFSGWHPSHDDLVGMTSGNPAGWDFPAVQREIAELGKSTGELRASLQAAVAHSAHRLAGHAPSTVCVLYYEPGNTYRLAMQGVMAYTPSENVIDVYVAPLPGWKDWVGYNVAHESHHAAWMHLHPNVNVFAFTLTDYLVFEGRADQFATSVTGQVGAWTQALPEADACRFMTELKPHLQDKGPLLPQVMFGRGGQYPRWTGYTLGYQIVGAFLRKHPAMSVTEWTAMDAATLFASSGYTPCAGQRKNAHAPAPR